MCILFFFVTYPVVHTHRSYFLSKWNCLDGFVVTVSLVALAFPQASIFRAFRAMRPLRVIVRSKKIQVGHCCDSDHNVKDFPMLSHVRIPLVVALFAARWWSLRW